ncbi:MAG: hypothetical protein ACI8W7_000479 [Gammaproteobacteria bacterium]|jgi:hypothetical protein
MRNRRVYASVAFLVIMMMVDLWINTARGLPSIIGYFDLWDQYIVPIFGQIAVIVPGLMLGNALRNEVMPEAIIIAVLSIALWAVFASSVPDYRWYGLGNLAVVFFGGCLKYGALIVLSCIAGAWLSARPNTRMEPDR